MGFVTCSWDCHRWSDADEGEEEKEGRVYGVAHCGLMVGFVDDDMSIDDGGGVFRISFNNGVWDMISANNDLTISHSTLLSKFQVYQISRRFSCT